MLMHDKIEIYADKIDETLALLEIAIALNEDGLLPLSALNTPVQVTFPAWDGIRIGTTYQLLWDGQPTGPVKPALHTDMPGDILTLEIPVNVLLEGKHQIAYLLTNNNNGTTAESPPTPIEIDRSAPGTPLLAPILFPAIALDGLTSDELDSLGGVLSGGIPGYSGMAKSDHIRTYWNGRPGPEAVVDEDDMGLRRVTVEFSRAFLQSIGDIEAPVYYTVTDLAGNLSVNSTEIRVSLQLSVVTPVPGPQVREAVGDTLDPANTTNGATVLIGASANLRHGDRVVVNWQGTGASDSKEKVITDAEVGVELPVLFSNALVNANLGVTLAISYILYRANGTAQPSTTLYLRVIDNQRLEFDTSPVTLDGKIYLLPGSPDLLPDFPAGTTLQRTASGGQPPYTYSSSNRLVAVVDDNGLTSVRGKGTATISVTDSQGNSAHYPVTVTGVVHCIGVGAGKYAQLAAAAAGHGARLPSLQELREVHAAYGNRWPMGNGLYWSVSLSHQVGLRWFFLKDLPSGKEYKLSELGAALGFAIR